MTQTTQLTPREAEVAGLVLAGLSNKAIARSLHITESTVEFHLKNIFNKLEVGSRAELIVKLGKSTVAAETNGAQDASKSAPAMPARVSSTIGRLLGMENVAREPGAGAAPTFVGAVRTCLVKYADFGGRAGRAEFWWFALFFLLVVAAATAIHAAAGEVATLALLLPLLAAGARRLRDAGYSAWWLLLLLAPVGGLIAVGCLWALPGVDAAAEEAAEG